MLQCPRMIVLYALLHCLWLVPITDGASGAAVFAPQKLRCGFDGMLLKVTFNELCDDRKGNILAEVAVESWCERCRVACLLFKAVYGENVREVDFVWRFGSLSCWFLVACSWLCLRCSHAVPVDAHVRCDVCFTAAL